MKKSKKATTGGKNITSKRNKDDDRIDDMGNGAAGNGNPVTQTAALDDAVNHVKPRQEEAEEDVNNIGKDDKWDEEGTDGDVEEGKKNDKQDDQDVAVHDDEVKDEVEDKNMEAVVPTPPDDHSKSESEESSEGVPRKLGVNEKQKREKRSYSSLSESQETPLQTPKHGADSNNDSDDELAYDDNDSKDNGSRKKIHFTPEKKMGKEPRNCNVLPLRSSPRRPAKPQITKKPKTQPPSKKHAPLDPKVCTALNLCRAAKKYVEKGKTHVKCNGCEKLFNYVCLYKHEEYLYCGRCYKKDVVLQVLTTHTFISLFGSCWAEQNPELRTRNDLVKFVCEYLKELKRFTIDEYVAKEEWNDLSSAKISKLQKS
jgi:hypothetical protein